MENDKPVCANCRGSNVALGMTIQNIRPPHAADHSTTTEGQWFRCLHCGHRWFTPQPSIEHSGP